MNDPVAAICHMTSERWGYEEIRSMGVSWESADVKVRETLMARKFPADIGGEHGKVQAAC
jgi:hypothetical protein